MTKKKSGKCSSESTSAALAQADHPRYLGDPTIVDGLLRPLFKAALDDCTAYLDHQLTIDEASASEKALAGTLANVLLGQDERYGVMGTWNTGGALPAFLRRQLDIKTADDRQAVVEALLALTIAAWGIHRRYVQDPAIDWKGQIDSTLASFTGLFIGIPLPRS